MSRTLLYTVQRVLEKLDLDEVNSINDTTDSLLIAREAEDTLYDLINRNEWPERYDLIEIESVGDVANPTALRIPSDFSKIKSVRYNTTESGETDIEYTKLIQLDPEEFLDLTYSRKSSDTNIDVSVYNSIEIFVYNDRQPEYFTVFDNDTLICDAYDSEVETTLQGSKTSCRASSLPTFEMTDEYVVPFDNKSYPLYLSELTAAASFALNGEASPEEERRRNRGISRLRREASKMERLSTRNDFGRRGTGRT